ncbi:MAG: hypothetical protein ACR2MO_07185 [Acidimicrobiales bacterium]
MRVLRRIVLPLVGLVALAACGQAAPKGAAGDADQRYEGDFTVLESPKHGPELCHVLALSLPPQCGGPAVVGWDWNAVEGEETVRGTTWGGWHVTGTFDGERFTLTGPAGPERPQDQRQAPDFSAACAQPDGLDQARDSAEWDTAPHNFATSGIPDLVASWVSYPTGPGNGPVVANVVVLPGSRQAAFDHIRTTYAGPLCVAERDGPTAARLAEVQKELDGDDAVRVVLGRVKGTSPDQIRGVVVATVWVAGQASLDYVDQRWDGLVELEPLLRPVA